MSIFGKVFGSGSNSTSTTSTISIGVTPTTGTTTTGTYQAVSPAYLQQLQQGILNQQNTYGGGLGQYGGLGSGQITSATSMYPGLYQQIFQTYPPQPPRTKKSDLIGSLTKLRNKLQAKYLEKMTSGEIRKHMANNSSIYQRRMLRANDLLQQGKIQMLLNWAGRWKAGEQAL